MHELLKGLLPPMLTRALQAAKLRRRHYFGLDNLDEKLEAYVDFDDGYFVELGANNGVSQSNTLHFERYRNWRGVLVEPVPHHYLQCKANRSKRTRVFCNACVSFDYPELFVPIAYSDLMSTPVGVESDVGDPLAHARSGRHLPAATDDNFIFGGAARTLNSILLESAAPSYVDLLSLDVEGAEIEVLKGVDHCRYRFRYICVACRDISRLDVFLGSHGYRLIDQLSVRDYLFRPYTGFGAGTA
jgi:FkbM family methyltransferase